MHRSRGRISKIENNTKREMRKSHERINTKSEKRIDIIRLYLLLFFFFIKQAFVIIQAYAEMSASAKLPMDRYNFMRSSRCVRRFCTIVHIQRIDFEYLLILR